MSSLVSEGPRALSHPLVIMDGMELIVFVVLVVAVGVAAALAGVEVTRRRLAAAPVPEPSVPAEPEVPVDLVVRDAVAAAMAEMRLQSAADRDVRGRDSTAVEPRRGGCPILPAVGLPISLLPRSLRKLAGWLSRRFPKSNPNS